MKKSVTLNMNPKTEAQHQSNVFKWSLLVRDKYPELALLYHIPNGGSRDMVEGRHLKDQGVKSGVPDMHLPIARGGYHGLFVELKADSGSESANQRWWRERLGGAGYYAAVCRGWEAAIELIGWYLGLSVEK